MSMRLGELPDWGRYYAEKLHKDGLFKEVPIQLAAVCGVWVNNYFRSVYCVALCVSYFLQKIRCLPTASRVMFAYNINQSLRTVFSLKIFIHQK